MTGIKDKSFFLLRYTPGKTKAQKQIPCGFGNPITDCSIQLEIRPEQNGHSPIDGVWRLFTRRRLAKKLPIDTDFIAYTVTECNGVAKMVLQIIP